MMEVKFTMSAQWVCGSYSRGMMGGRGKHADGDANESERKKFYNVILVTITQNVSCTIIEFLL